jgi:hypothetical protein
MGRLSVVMISYSYSTTRPAKRDLFDNFNVRVDRARRLATTWQAKHKLKSAQSALRSNDVFGGGRVTKRVARSCA